MGRKRLGGLSSRLDTEHGPRRLADFIGSADLGRRDVRQTADSNQSVDFQLVSGAVFVSDVWLDGFLQSADGDIPGESQFILGIPQHARDAQLVLCQANLFKYCDADASWLFISAGKGKTLLLGFFCSLSIEVMQYVFHCGMFEFDDIVGNMAGVLIGIGVYSVVKGMRRHLNRRF